MADPHMPTTLVDWLDDLTVRFILNLPASELSSVPRLCFQVEEAQWYYEDFVRPAVAAAGAPPLPSLTLRNFHTLLFQHCPLFNGFTDEQHMRAYDEFLAYKVRVPVRGAILLDERMKKVILVRGWKGSSWSFPRGKINKDERDLDCAVREVWEETGFDIRAAGLVPDNEDDASAIDVTMREQHMRLFIFRGVPEDTHFEPKTRKEISKIEWYSIKDLPGFKRQKAGQVKQGQETIPANKFYMVAPFLGHLKKWISQQQRQDAELAKRQSANGHGLTTGTEDEGEVEDETTPERDSGVDLRAEQLKQMLNISAATPSDSESQVRHSAGLLAMLQGQAKRTSPNKPPRTPFDQINTFPQQPESPHPDHTRQPSSSGQQRDLPPRFPLSPVRQQEELGRHYSLPTPNVFGPAQNGFPPPNQLPSGYHGLPPHMQPQQAPLQRQSMPPAPTGLMGVGPGDRYSPGPQFHQQQGRPPSQHLPPHMLPPHLQQQPYLQQGPPHPQMPQGPQGALGSGPSVPNASQLPAPRQLGAEKIRLLDAFRNQSNRATPPAPATQGQTKQRLASTHQTALLDLFRKPSHPSNTPQHLEAPRSPVTEKTDVPEPASPTGTDVTVKPSTVRKATLNEITRTLPMSKPKTKSPPVLADIQSSTQPPIAQQQPTRASQQHMRPDPPRERQLFDPNNPMKFTPATVMQPSKAERHIPDQKRNSRELKNTSPSRTSGPSQNGNRQTPPPFTILARPGSAKGGPKSPVPPPSPLRNESSQPAFHPQVLKRPKDADAIGAEQKTADRKDQLLALFGKSNTTPTPPPELQPTLKRAESKDDQKSALLDLFNTSSPASTPTAHPSTSTAPPPAPRIEPEQRPTSSSRQQPTLSTTTTQPPKISQQNLLLDLFNNKKQTPTSTSPGTPISPFTLGTPAVEEQVRQLGSLAGLVNAAPPTKAVNGKGPQRSASGEQSPQEQKDFLMGFLKGVVRDEGARAGGGRR